MRASVADRLAPQVREQIWSIATHGDDRRFLTGIFEHIPAHIAPRLLTEYQSRQKAHGLRAANLYAGSLKAELLPDLCPGSGLAFDASDDEIGDAAQTAAREVIARLCHGASEAEMLATLTRIAHRYRVDLPRSRCFAGIVARMCEPAWWRRALRKRFQRVEHAAIRAGYVHRHAALFVSDEAFRRHERHARRVARMMQALESVNLTTGETAAMTDVLAHSLANPANRRAAMMVCVKGLEAYASAEGYAGLFLTITCPSRMHARMAETGAANPAYNWSISPRRAQAHLRRLWNDGTRKLVRDGLEYFGVRVAEPHHDGTPHWHVLAFVRAGQEEAFTATLRMYALRDSPDEPGASERRFTVIPIDPERGSAAGYIIKYVSKNLDGAGVGDEDEGGTDARSAAPRAVVWGKTWGIRQFQFFGAGSVTPFRELYRLDGLPDASDPRLVELWAAVKAKDYAAFVRARKAGCARLPLLYDAAPSQRYPGEIARRLRGVVFEGDSGPVQIITRTDTWEIRESPAGKEARAKARRASARWKQSGKERGFASPWTRFNNSAPVDPTELFSPLKTIKTDPEFDIGGLGFYLPHGETARARAILVRTPGNRVGSFKPGEG